MEYTQLYHTNRYVRYVRMYIATVRTTDKPHMGTHEQSFICIDIKKKDHGIVDNGHTKRWCLHYIPWFI